MNKNFRFVIVAVLVVCGLSINAQWTPKSLSIGYTNVAPVIDGVGADAAWQSVEEQLIDVPFADEVVSLGTGATFKAVWDNEYMYVLVEVPDDNWYPYTEAGVNSWQADKIELYFDVNANRIDGGGPSDDAGHIQVAPNVDDIWGGLINDYEAAYIVDAGDANYIFEFAIPYSLLLDEYSQELDPTVRNTIGFDISIIDLDEDGLGGNDSYNGGVGRINWSNNTEDVVEGGIAGESWNTLDQAGVLTFENSVPYDGTPVAEAGSHQMVTEGDTVYLDGSASYDREDAYLYGYLWSCEAISSIVNRTAAQAYFKTPNVKQDTDFWIYLMVSDSDLNTDVDSVKITVLRVNNAPVAIAGEDAEFDAGEVVWLDATSSYDIDDDALLYLWQSLDGIELTDNRNAKCQFVASSAASNASYRFVLTVSDGEMLSLTDTVEITVLGYNNAPVANAGEDIRVQSNEAVTISAQNSFDEDGDTLAYKWESIDGIHLTNTYDIVQEFSAPEVIDSNSYRFVLTVSDSIVASAPDTVVVMVVKEETSINYSFKDAADYVVYPSVVKSTITVCGEFNGYTELTLLSIDGREVYGETIKELGYGEVDIDVSKQQVGAYMLFIRTGEEVYSEKIIINR